jgi:hypothetical protein
MSAKAYKGNSVIHGMWHFTPESLKALDEILDDAWSWMEREHTRLVRENTNKEFKTDCDSGKLADLTDDQRQSYRKRLRTREKKRLEYTGHERIIRITFTSDTKLEVERFQNALVAPVAAREMPKGFTVVLSAARMKLEIEESTFLGTSLRLSVSPHDSDRLSEFMTRITQWAESCELPLWQRYWSSWVGFHWFFLPIFAVIAFSLANALNLGTDGSYALRKEAFELLNDGLSPEEVGRANEITLSLLSGYYSRTPAGPSGTSVILGATVLGLFGLLFSSAPTTAIGIGLGKKLIDKQKMMMAAIRLTINFVIFGVVASYVASILYEWRK